MKATPDGPEGRRELILPSGRRPERIASAGEGCRRSEQRDGASARGRDCRRGTRRGERRPGVPRHQPRCRDAGGRLRARRPAGRDHASGAQCGDGTVRRWPGSASWAAGSRGPARRPRRTGAPGERRRARRWMGRGSRSAVPRPGGADSQRDAHLNVCRLRSTGRSEGTLPTMSRTTPTASPEGRWW